MCANGAIAAGMAGGVEVAEVATRITGNATLFCASVAGPYGGIAWMSRLG